MMKKTILAVLLLSLSALAAEAQTQSLGLEMGFAQPILRENSLSSTKKLSTSTKLNGLKVGLVYDATLIKGFGFRMGVNYTYGGNHTDWTAKNSFATADKTKTRTQFHTIEVPIDWQYKFEIAKETYLIVYTGPAFQYTFSFDKTTYEKNELTKTSSTTKASHYATDADGDGTTDYQPWNLTWGVGAGFQFQNYYIRGGYDFGIVNHYKDRQFDCSTNTENEYKMRGRFDQWSIKIGIYFLNF